MKAVISSNVLKFAEIRSFLEDLQDLGDRKGRVFLTKINKNFPNMKGYLPQLKDEDYLKVCSGKIRRAGDFFIKDFYWWYEVTLKGEELIKESWKKLDALYHAGK